MKEARIVLQGKTVVLGVTGSIAAYKMANVASMLKKLNCDVHVIMTRNAVNFINPITFESLTGNKCLVDTFDRNFQFHIAHVSLAKKADLLLVAPATANMIAKLAYGIADDMLSTTALACQCPLFIAPAMNTRMFHHPTVKENLETLRHRGATIISPESGLLACGDIGDGKLVKEEILLDYIIKELAFPKDMVGVKVLVSAGPTRESIDPVRYITNHSSGKMGYEIARHCMLRGADVTLVSGPTALAPVPFVTMVPIESAEDMFEAIKAISDEQDIIIKAAAVADYRPTETATEKIKKKDDDMSISLERTKDILQYLGTNRKEGQFICGFSMETQNMLENSRKKLQKKHIDMIVANNLKDQGAGFGTDTNIVTIITDKEEVKFDQMKKSEVAKRIIDYILKKKNFLLSLDED